MDGEPIPMGQVALAQMRDATDAQKIALAIQLANSVTDPREAPNVMRLASLAGNVGDALRKQQFLKENER